MKKFKNGAAGILVVCLLVLVGCIPSMAHAGRCGEFEYAELMDMDQAVFLKAYCKVLDIAPTYIGVYEFAPRRDKPLYRDDALGCSKAMELMERVYMKRFKVDSLDALKAECKK